MESERDEGAGKLRVMRAPWNVCARVSARLSRSTISAARMPNMVVSGLLYGQIDSPRVRTDRIARIARSAAEEYQGNASSINDVLGCDALENDHR